MIYKSQILNKESVSSLEKHSDLLWDLLTDPQTPLLLAALRAEDRPRGAGGGVHRERNEEGI